MEFIDLKEQYRRYKTEINDRIRSVLTHGHFIMGPEIAELEQSLAKYVGVKHCITVSSGTTSLEIALRALGVGLGDEVITVPFTWISTAEVIGLVGARPIFVDIEPATYNINVELIEAAITAQTKAILPVNLFGAEIVGYESLKDLAARIYGPADPLDRFVAEEPYRLIKQDGHYCLKLKLPFVVKEHIDLSMVSDELILRIGSYKRHILLPKQVATQTSVKAKIEEPYLNITFGGGVHE